MSTALDTTTDTTLDYRTGDPTGGRLTSWASSLQAAHKIGSALCQTAFAPKHFRGNPDEAAAAILYGDEIGLSPTQALRSIFVIGGQPGMYARQMVAIVLHHGHQVWTVEKTAAKVTVAGQRRNSSHVIEETWTTARAQKAGYTSNPKYKTDPESMLYARAAADVCRQVAPDALAGLAYSVEELEIDQPAATTTVRRSTPKTARRKPVEPPQAQEPPLEPTPAPEPDVEDAEEVTDPDPITDAQMKRMHAGFNDIGMTERDDRLNYCAGVIGREVSSSKDLTKHEATQVIDSLATDAERPDEQAEFQQEAQS